MRAPAFHAFFRYGYYEQGGLAKMDEDIRVMELVEDTVSSVDAYVEQATACICTVVVVEKAGVSRLRVWHLSFVPFDRRIACL